ncbi:MAG: hypothetical protein KGD57_02645 [Candidatus Lokiarchaeota archaeon]|nr:hypothetical protein [Candidatus Lokiarchaeota archaeon]
MVSQERKRYILFKILNESIYKYDKNEFINIVWHSIWRYYGMNVVNKIGLWIIDLNLEKNYGIIRCSHKSKEIIISALSLIKEIKGKRIIIIPIKTSGTLKKIKKTIRTLLK